MILLLKSAGDDATRTSGLPQSITRGCAVIGGAARRLGAGCRGVAGPNPATQAFASDWLLHGRRLMCASRVDGGRETRAFRVPLWHGSRQPPVSTRAPIIRRRPLQANLGCLARA